MQEEEPEPEAQPGAPGLTDEELAEYVPFTDEELAEDETNGNLT